MVEAPDGVCRSIRLRRAEVQPCEIAPTLFGPLWARRSAGGAHRERLGPVRLQAGAFAPLKAVPFVTDKIPAALRV